ncbi:TIGR04197 family type VII secretion effector [Carnobacterium gallinarum]|uniref:TIGR04197 family type VII secretion effector n=1 Tax=Carnobacterium gallinarum TaxID=2749 RepID=UPI00054DB325|nr:TIGR04197 family type VII secretion effector [Carnobacterium gallinarum]
MSTIEVNPVAAHNQATKICQASDKLAISNIVTFSRGTTISGNECAKSTFQKLKQNTYLAQQLLNRDVESIQSVMTAFTRTDEHIKKLLDESLLGSSFKGGAVNGFK